MCVCVCVCICVHEFMGKIVECGLEFGQFGALHLLDACDGTEKCVNVGVGVRVCVCERERECVCVCGCVCVHEFMDKIVECGLEFV